MSKEKPLSHSESGKIIQEDFKEWFSKTYAREIKAELKKKNKEKY